MFNSNPAISYSNDTISSIFSGLPGMQVAANAYGVPPSQSAQAAVAAVTAATAAAVNGQQMPPGVGGTQQAAGTAVQAALAAQQGAGLTAAAALAQQVCHNDC